MFFQIYGETAGWQLLGWLLVFAGLVIMNEIARRSKWGGIACFLVLPAVLSVYFIAIYIGAASGAEWALNNDTYVHMNSWFHYAKLYAATAGCIGFMILKYHWGKLGKAHWFKAFPFVIGRVDTPPAGHTNNIEKPCQTVQYIPPAAVQPYAFR